MVVYTGRDAYRPAGLTFTAVGLILLAVGGWFGSRQYTIVTSWPSVEAMVTKSRVTHHLGRHGTVYQARMDFQYTVGGQTFEATSGPGYSTSNHDAMKGMADTYRPGTRRTLRYNPSNPYDIRMNAGYNFGFFFLPVLLGGMGLLFAGLGVVALVASRRVQPLLCPACGQAIEPRQRFCPNCATPLQATDNNQTPPATWAA